MPPFAVPSPPGAVRRALAPIRAFLLDMDGTIYLGDRLFPWTHAFLARAQQTGRLVRFLTNNSSRAAASYVAKLRRLGLDVADDAVFTSGQAAARHLAGLAHPPTRIWALGTQELHEELQSAGFLLDPQDPQHLVLGYPTDLTYEGLARFALLLQRGLPYLATHPDLVCPSPEGPLPDTGSLIALFAQATGREPDTIVGKPEPGIFLAAADALELAPGQLAMVGDRLYTDIAGARAAGLLSILVLSGETQAADLAHSPHRPDLVLPSLDALTQAMT